MRIALRAPVICSLCIGLFACQPTAPPPPAAATIVTAAPTASTSAAAPDAPLETALAARISAQHMTRLVGRLARVVVRKLERACKVDLDQLVGKVDLLLLSPKALRLDINSSMTVTQASCILGELGQGKNVKVAPLPQGVRISSLEPAEPASIPPELARQLDEHANAATSVLAASLSPNKPLTSALLEWNDKGLEAKLTLPPSNALALANWWRNAQRSGAKQLKRISMRAQASTLTFQIAAGELSAQDVALAIQLRRHALEAFRIPSQSMVPSLLLGDHVFVDKTELEPKRSEVMVFRYPENRDMDFMKRVVGLPGDTIEILDGRPIINGELAPHCFVGELEDEQGARQMYVEFLAGDSYLTAYNEKPTTKHCSSNADCGSSLVCRSQVCGELQGPFVVAAAEAWVMGDNRDNSLDSRHFDEGRGAGVPFADFKGRAAIIWLSWGSDGLRTERLLHRTDEPLVPNSDPLLSSRLKECLRQRVHPLAKQSTPESGK